MNKFRLSLILLIALLLLVFVSVVLIQLNSQPAAPVVTATAVAQLPTQPPSEANSGVSTPETPGGGGVPGVTVIPPATSTPVGGSQTPVYTDAPALPTPTPAPVLQPTPQPTPTVLPPTAVPTVELVPPAIPPTEIPPAQAPTAAPPPGEIPAAPRPAESFLPLVFAAPPSVLTPANPQPEEEEPAPSPTNPPSESEPPSEQPGEPTREPPTAEPAGKSYYVDCVKGDDNANGRAKKSAWQTVGRANLAKLLPGDALLLKRGCSWRGPLDANWQGTDQQPVTIGAYGEGEMPVIQDSYGADVRIGGKYQIIQDLHATLSTPPNPDPDCDNQPRGWIAGFAFEAGSSYNTVRSVKATRLTIGVFFHTNSNHNRLLNSTITDNNVLETLTPAGSQGATGVSLHGNYQEVARNYFANNRSLCTYNGVQESIAIELYTASNSNIHHNIVYNDRVFIEMGSNSSWVSENNTLAYNLHVSDYASDTMGARFLVTRGYGHVHGPVLGTKVLNNVVYLTGAGAKGISCQLCGNDILTVRNNILWANDEPFSTDNGFVESNNIFWSNDGSPSLRWRGFAKSPSSLVADPQFVNPKADDFRLKRSSPAIRGGMVDSASPNYEWDLQGNPLSATGPLDIGAFAGE